MAIHYSRNASVSYASQDLSDHVRSVTINVSSDEVDVTAMGAVAHAVIPGLRNDEITIEFYVDAAASKVDQTLWPYVGSTSGATLIVKNDSGSVSTTNPSWTVTSSPLQYEPINAQIGEAHTTTVTFKPVAGGYIVRAT